ncbi:vitamin B12 ABC transporter substrate-binding protein BtuF [Vibrio sp. TH_r3]|uniref:vitamin B12 ABC transporter substrate-binding protein BtuF n=1 Tax=Vibrio sp. TH_r3 TaxID=3082084 RepID=UPI0029545C09|nr:vitamin B12 ABC transporter substrate-binding protein BtuF [Vibrio sp. TH_r3]MDV7105195.1 vitamin B12 ABC transporter substrate-binding protein BtuF [Vibrio sp. TH_r3]
MRFLLFLLLLSIALFSYSIERIISLAPSSTELIYAAGLENKLIAVSAYSDYPERAKLLERVASFNSVNIERIVALNPELIVAWRSGGSIKALNQLKQLGFTIYYSDTTHLADIADKIEDLSQYADDPSVGQNNAQQFRDKLHQLQNKYSNLDSVQYFYQLSSKPIYTIANNHWPSEVFSLCGGKNSFEESPVAYPQVGIEQVIVSAPDVIFTSPHTIQDTKIWQQWHNQIPAVENNFIWSLNADWLNRPTPRSLQAVEQVCQYLNIVRNTHSVKN